MAQNTLTNIQDKILARGLMVLREAAIMPRLVNIDYSGEAAQKGTTIDIPTSKAQTVADVVAGPTYSSAQGVTPGLTQVSMSNWKKTDFFLTDKDMVEVDRNKHFLPLQSEEAAKALANDIDTTIHKDYLGIYGFVGTAGVVPFSTIATATGARKVLNEQLAPMSDRRVVLDPNAEDQALQLAAFSDVSQSTDRDVKIEGEIGRKLGLDFFMSQNVQTHTVGTNDVANGAVVGSTTAIGVSTLLVKADSIIGTVVTGDVFTIAGDTQTYVITGASASLTSAGVNFTIDPALKVIASATSKMTFKATHVVNLCFQRGAFVYVTRPLMSSVTSELLGGVSTRALVDNQTGITLRLEVIRQNKQVEWEFDVLYGSKLLRPELAARIAG